MFGKKEFILESVASMNQNYRIEDVLINFEFKKK